MAREGSPAGRSALARLLGWPARRLLDPRVHWTVNLVNERLIDRTEALHRHMERLEEQHRGIHEKLVPLRVEELLGRGHGSPAELTLELGLFLNWAEGHEGFAAQAELWFNQPVALDYRGGAVEARQVNERIVEQPFVFAALAELEPPARVLDIGGAESTVGLSLAAIGHQVTLVDPRGFPIAHPCLRTVAARLDELDPGIADFDAAVAVSAVEHFGLGHYGADTGGRLDIDALDELRRRLRPGGILALTVPFGEPVVDEFERVYDDAGLTELLAGWHVERARAAWRVDALTWLSGALDEPRGPRGVALVVARNPAP